METVGSTMLSYEYLQTVTVLYKVAIYGRGKELRKYTFVITILFSCLGSISRDELVRANTSQILQARRQLSSGPTSCACPPPPRTPTASPRIWSLLVPRPVTQRR